MCETGCTEHHYTDYDLSAAEDGAYYDGKEQVKEEIRDALNNIFKEGELEAGLEMLKELSDYADV